MQESEKVPLKNDKSSSRGSSPDLFMSTRNNHNNETHNITVINNKLQDKDYNLDEEKKKSHEFKQIEKELNNVNKINDETKRTGTHTVKLFDKIVEEIGYGKEQWVIILVAGINFMLQGIYFFLNSAMFIPVQKYYQVDDTAMSIAASMPYTSGIGTSLILGYLSKLFGRLNMIYLTTVTIIICQIGICVINNFVAYCFFLFIIGGMLNLNGPVLTNILAEFLPVKNRAFCMGTIWGWYSLGNITLLLLYLFYMPVYDEKKFYKMMWIMLIFPIFAYTMTLFFLNNSPRAMINTDKEKEGLELLSKMYCKTESYKERYLINNFESNRISIEGDNNIIRLTTEEQISRHRQVERNNQLRDDDRAESNLSFSFKSKDVVFTDTEQQQLIHEIKDYKLHKDPLIAGKESGINDLFSNNWRKLSILLSILWVMNSMIGYGPYFILPLTLYNPNNENINAIENQTFNTEVSVIKSQMWIAIIGLIANPIGGFMCELKFLGRKNTGSISCLLATINCIACLFNFSNVVTYLSILNIMNTLTFNTTITYTAEVYPTHLRDFSSGFMNCLGNAGAMVSQPLYILFHNIAKETPYLFTAIFGFISFICFCLFPYETLGMELDYE